MQPSASSSTHTIRQEDPNPSDFLTPFLSRLKLTVLPAPLPTDEHKFDPIFTPTNVQDQVAIMDACLQDLHSVRRAQTVFERLRLNNKAVLHAEIYNNVLFAYKGMALREHVKGVREAWLNQAWQLFDDMVSGREEIEPNGTTFATMFDLYSLRQSAWSHEELITLTLERELDILDIVANPSISPDIAQELITSLSKVALEMGRVNIVNDLAKASSIAQGNVADGPEVRVTKKPVKEGKQTEVPFNIQNLRDHLAYVAYARHVLPDDAVARQRHLELSAYDIEEGRMKVQNEQMEQLGLDKRFQDKKLQAHMYRWNGELATRIKEELKKIEREEESGKYRIDKGNVLTPYLSLVRADRLSLITILETMRLTGTGGIVSGMKTTRAVVSIGKAVEMEYKARVCKQNKLPVPDMSRHDIANAFSDEGYENLHQRRVAAAKQLVTGESWTAPWSQLTRAQIGAILLECLMDVATIRRVSPDLNTGKSVSEDHPVFYHSYEYNRGTKLGVIKVNPAISDRIANDSLHGTIHPRHLPMLIPPKPWIGASEGAYLFSKAHLMRFKEGIEQEKYLDEAIKKGNMELVMAGLNVLGRTPWQINKNIFEVVLQVWNQGERVGKLPPAVYEESEPAIPTGDQDDVRARAIYLQKHKQWQQKVAANHSERCSTNYKIEIARAFLDETIYFPHNMDFRGRAYPLPPHLNHIGDDLSRGLLMFNEARPLGERGLRWLKIHVANLYGFDKADFNERVEWVHERLDSIKDCAKNPLNGNKMWQQADDPWQFLAAAMELTAALESADPHQHMSHLPIHQDGTCNGLQHYAAMGGDKQGAQQVNLAASDRPSDVYTFVGNKVEMSIAEDAAKGNAYAKILQGKITRKVVKQTVMTTVYGVTFVGARDQIEGQLEARGDIPIEECWNTAGYLAKKVLHCIGDTFQGARGIQNWLNICARLVSKSIAPERFQVATDQYVQKMKKGSAKLKSGQARMKKEQMTSVIWTTALGLPVVQPYRKTSRKQIMTNIQSVYISDPNIPNEVNSQKQATAFPPNFVHSLDATHMLLTALECNRRNLVFASVHDSYWTHACDVDEMSSVIRETFIQLHSTDVLKRLSEEFKTRYKGYRLPVIYLASHGNVRTKLLEAGARLRVTSSQAEKLAGLGKLLEISDDSAIEEKDLLLPQDGEIASNASDAAELLSEECEEDMELLDENDKVLSSAKAEMLGKFVDVTELIPPLPEKGDFNVNDIRESAYFFS
ncbi:mitochondrial RNA polymerase [Coprinopsis marcescibilis]|uniref:DNA-directed RNA polymerase n=1 Tax=Coprinopsis marcescibilis TaxID=230819 RepID=A0A5C3L8L0_COPMA|nr:mitochondrial RNA polymerase [Coprinopsis marcescibilis]